MLEVEPATKLSPAPIQKHLLGGFSIDMPLSNCYRRVDIISRWNTLLLFSFFGGGLTMLCMFVV